MQIADAADNVTITNDGSLSKRIYGPVERIVLRGVLFQATVNSSNGTATIYSPLANISSLNVTIRNGGNGANFSNFTLNTSSTGSYYSQSDYEPGGRLITAPGATGYYYLLLTYKDDNNISWPFRMDFFVANQTLDDIRVYSDKTSYYGWETLNIAVETIRNIGDGVFAVANLSVQGSIRTSAKVLVSSFNCTTGNDGRCMVNGITVPSTVGQYILEVNNYTGVSGFRVIPYDSVVYMKDDSGTRYKSFFNPHQEANVEVTISFNGTTPVSGSYTFTGNVTNSSKSVLQVINTTSLTMNNSFTNSFKFLLNNNFSNGNYMVWVRVVDNGGNVVIRSTSFQVRDWSLSFAKAETGSGFDYEYSVFPNTSVTFDVFPVERVNGTLLANLSQALFNFTLKNSLGVVLNSSNSTAFNLSCGKQGCYKYSIRLPAAVGNYRLSVTVNYSDEILIAERGIAILNATMTIIPGDSEGQLKELFGTSEFVYFTVKAKNQTHDMNVTYSQLDALLYENGTYLTYNEVSNWNNVNGSNDVLEWAWNITHQRLKIDVPKGGGSYFARVSSDNGTVVGNVRFVVNPYDTCIVAKTTAGSVGSGSYYAWQYKASDIIYFEVKLVQADNPLGKSQSSNGTSTYREGSNYGMGTACSFDTTKKQVVNNATLSVEDVVNTQAGVKANLNLSASTCKSDDESGGYTCTIRHANDSWDGGRYSVKLKILGQDGKTSDIAYGLFESRAFYIWAWGDKWLNQPGGNITFNLRMYQAGTNWWNSVGTSGLSGSVKVEKIEYYGRQGEWIWPPVVYDYNLTGVNDTTITSGSGTLYLNVSLAGKKSWDSGSYSVVLRGTESGGNTDFGQAWFEVRNWDSYASPVELTSSGFDYKSYFGSKQNVTLYVRITSAGDYGWTSGGSALVNDKSNITVTVKKIMDYSSYPAREMDKNTYNATVINVNASSPWYSSATKTGHSGYLLNITNLNGTWNSGYYNVVLDLNGTETGYGWFNTIAFYVNTQPVDIKGAYKYNHKGSGPVHFLITTTKGYKNGYTHNVTTGITDYVNTTVKDIKLNRWSDTDYTYTELKYPADFNVTNATHTTINYSRIVSLNHSSGTWPSGYYYGSMVLINDDNETSTGYIWFNVQSFRVDYVTDSYTIGTSNNISGILSVRDPDWSNNSIVWGNYTVTEIYQESWDYNSRSRTSVTNYNPITFNGSANLSIAPLSQGWIPGWGNLVAVVYDNTTNTSKNVWISFRAALFSTAFGTVTSQDAITQTQNVTIPVTLTNPVGGGSTSGNLTRVYETIWPNTIDYQFTIGNCTSTSSSSCKITSSQNVTVHVPSGGWGEEYHYLTFVLSDANNLNSKTAESAPWFRVRASYTGYFDNYNESNFWGYYVGFNSNASFTVGAQNNSGQNQDFSVVSVQHAYNPGCYSEYCRVYSSVGWSNPANKTDNRQVIRILNSGSWSRGEHAIRVNVRGSLGTSTLKTGYFYAKDNTTPNLTLVAPPYNGYKVNSSSLYLNAVTNEAATCTYVFQSYDAYYANYCGNTDNVGANNTNLVGTCNKTLYNGTFYNYHYFSHPYPGLSTGGVNHSFNLQGVGNILTTDQDYSVIYNCYDDDYNTVALYRIIEMNSTSNTTNITMQFTSSQLANNSYINANSFVVNLSVGNGIANLTYRLYNSTHAVLNSTTVTSTTSSLIWYLTNNNTLYYYNVTGIVGNGTNVSSPTRNVTFDTILPVISFNGNTTSGNNTMYNRTWIYASVNVTEVNEANITFSLFYNNHTLVNQTILTTATRTFNWTSLVANLTGVGYFYNVTLTDKAANRNTTEIRLIQLNVSNTTSI